MSDSQPDSTPAPPPPRERDDYTGDFTPEEIAAATAPYDGPTYTLEEVMEHARKLAAEKRAESRA